MKVVIAVIWLLYFVFPLMNPEFIYFRGNTQGGNENHPVITASGKVLKRGHGMNKSGNSNPPAAAVEEPPVRDAVFMGTVHQAKGLEWPVVFVVRFNEEEFPLVGCLK